MRRVLCTFALAAFFHAPTTHAAFPALGDLGEKIKQAGDTAGKVGKVVKGVTGLSLEEELVIGDAVSVEIVSRYGGLWRDEAAMTRVNLVGRSLARYATRADLDWRFGLLASDSVNAFSAPGGRIFITRGLFQRLDTDDKLAGVLSHEIAHIDRRHAVRIIARGELLGGVSALVSERSRDFAQFDQAVSEVTTQILDKGFDRNTEFEADQEGRALAMTTGFAPGGLRTVLEVLRKQASGKSGEVFSTHPPLGERLKRLPADDSAAVAAPVAAPSPK